MQELSEATTKALENKWYELPKQQEFMVEHTVVTMGVRRTENEDLDKLAREIIHEEMNLLRVEIVQTKRMSTFY